MKEQRGIDTLAGGMFLAMSRANDPKNAAKGPWSGYSCEDRLALFMQEFVEAYEAAQTAIEEGGSVQDARRELGDVILTASILAEGLEVMA